MKYGFDNHASLGSDLFIDEFEHSKEICGLTFQFGTVVENSFEFQKSY